MFSICDNNHIKFWKKLKEVPQRVSNIKPFIIDYNWEAIICPSKIEDWKRFEKNNPTVAFIILYIKEK